MRPNSTVYIRRKTVQMLSMVHIKGARTKQQRQHKERQPFVDIKIHAEIYSLIHINFNLKLCL